MRAFHQLVVAALACLMPSALAAQVVMPDGSVIPAEAVRRAPEACDKGDSLACLATGFAAFEGRGQMVDTDDAAAAFRKACELGSGIGCEREAFIASYRHDKAQDLPLAEARRKQAVTILAKGCEVENPLACHWLATMLAEVSALQDEPRAASLYSKACFDHAFGPSCYKGYGLTTTYGSKAYDTTLSNRFDNAAETALDAACIAGKAGACQMQADWVSLRRGAAEAFYIAEMSQKACDGGVAEGCMRAGDLAYRLEQTPENWDRMHDLSERGCQMLFAQCAGFANLVRKPREGRTFDPYFIYLNEMLACIGDVEESCWRMFDYIDKLQPQDLEAFVMAFDHACLRLPRVWAEICATAANNHVERAAVVPASAVNDHAEARRLYSRALELPDDEEAERDAHAEARTFLGQDS